jgi:hypothetical protein
MNCSICGKEITTSLSVKRGIGPFCYAKLKRDEKRENSLPGEIVLTTNMGGEIEELINETALKSYNCLGLPKGHIEIVGAWHGYPHDGGLSDKNGKKWWAYQKCSQSNYEMAYWKIKNRIVETKEVTA